MSADFLDMKRLPFERPEVQELRSLLFQAYPHPEMARKKAYEAGMKAGTWPKDPKDCSNMLTVWHSVMIVLAEQEKLRSMVEFAAGDRSVSALRERFLEFLGNERVITISEDPELHLDKNIEWKNKPEPKHVLERLSYHYDRFYEIGLANKIARFARSVCHIQAKFEHCTSKGTGFLISPSHVLTNAHVLSNQRYGNLLSVMINFDHREGGDCSKLRRRGKPQTVFAQFNAEQVPHPEFPMDWATIELDAPMLKEDCVPIPLSKSVTPSAGGGVVIIHHPRGGMKRFSLEARALCFVNHSVIQYTTDTLGGSSGAPVFNEDMDLIGLHYAALQQSATIEINPKLNQQYVQVWQNAGLRIKPILESLEEQDIPFS